MANRFTNGRPKTVIVLRSALTLRQYDGSNIIFDFWATGCKTVRPMLSVVVCLSCPVCPVCNVRALWPNGWTDQDATWCGGRPQPRRLCDRWGLRSTFPQKWGQSPPPQFSAHFYCGQTAAIPLHASRCHLVWR